MGERLIVLRMKILRIRGIRTSLTRVNIVYEGKIRFNDAKGSDKGSGGHYR